MSGVGPAHYRAAEIGAAEAAGRADRWTDVSSDAQVIVAAINANTYATLALAAATALMPAVGNEGDTAAEWRALIVPPKTNPTERNDQ